MGIVSLKAERVRTRKKVMHLINSDGFYGAERVLVNLLSQMKKMGIPVVLGCLSRIDSEGAEIGKELVRKSVQVVYFNEKKKISLRCLILIYKAIKKHNIGLLHVHGYKATILGTLISVIMRVPVVATYHAEAGYLPELAFYAKIETFLLRIFVKRIIAVSRRIEGELIGRGIAKKRISVISNGIEDPAIGEIEDRARERIQEPPHLLCAGRLIRIKRFDLVIDAIAILQRDFPNIRCSIAGDGPMLKEWMKKAESAGVLGRITFCGFVSNMEELYRRANIFVICSETEGCPISLIEAMAFGLPIVTTRVGAIPDMITNGKEGIILSENSLECLVNTLRGLIRNPEVRLTLGREAREAFLERFSAKEVTESYLKIYEGV